jgi:hypothetical protein
VTCRRDGVPSRGDVQQTRVWPLAPVPLALLLEPPPLEHTAAVVTRATAHPAIASLELCSVFGLKHAFAFNFPDELPLRTRLGEAVGQILMDLIDTGDVLGLS